MPRVVAVMPTSAAMPVSPMLRLEPRHLVDEHGPALWALCRRLAAEPEDAYQDVWQRILEQLHRYDPERGTVRAWVLTIGHRRLVDRHRRRVVRGPVVPARDIRDLKISAEGAVDQRRAAARLEWAITQLPEAQRRVVVSHHIHGLELASLALAEGVAVGTIKSRLHRGRTALARLLQEGT